MKNNSSMLDMGKDDVTATTQDSEIDSVRLLKEDVYTQKMKVIVQFATSSLIRMILRLTKSKLQARDFSHE